MSLTREPSEQRDSDGQQHEQNGSECTCHAGGAIIHVAAGRRTPDVVQQIRQRYPSIPLLASGGSTDESTAETIAAGANALTWTPPSAQELQSSMMMRYRGEHAVDPRRGQGRVWATLSESDQTSQKDLAATFGMSRQAMAELLKKLEASGHISRRPSRRDSRVMMVNLTNQGRKAADLLGKAPDQTSSMLDCLNETELQTLHGYLQRIIDTSSDDLPTSTAEDVKKHELLIEHLKRRHMPADRA